MREKVSSWQVFGQDAVYQAPALFDVTPETAEAGLRHILESFERLCGTRPSFIRTCGPFRVSLRPVRLALPVRTVTPGKIALFYRKLSKDYLDFFEWVWRLDDRVTADPPLGAKGHQLVLDGGGLRAQGGRAGLRTLLARTGIRHRLYASAYVRALGQHHRLGMPSGTVLHGWFGSVQSHFLVFYDQRLVDMWTLPVGVSTVLRELQWSLCVELSTARDLLSLLLEAPQGGPLVISRAGKLVETSRELLGRIVSIQVEEIIDAHLAQWRQRAWPSPIDCFVLSGSLARWPFLGRRLAEQTGARLEFCLTDQTLRGLNGLQAAAMGVSSGVSRVSRVLSPSSPVLSPRMSPAVSSVEGPSATTFLPPSRPSSVVSELASVAPPRPGLESCDTKIASMPSRRVEIAAYIS